MTVQMENWVLSKIQLRLTLLQLFSHFELFLRKGLLSLEMRYLVCENKAKLTNCQQAPHIHGGSGFPL